MTIERSVAHDNGSRGAAPVGIWAAGSNRVTIQYCESYANHTMTGTDGGGFDFDWDVTNSTMQYNYSHGNDGPAYMLCGANHKSDGNTIRYNISQNDSKKNGRGAIHIYGNSHNTKIYNNTVYMSPTGNGNSAAFSAVGSGASMTNIDVRNNIFKTTGGVKLVRVDSGFTGQWTNKLYGNAYDSSGSGFNINYNGKTYYSLSTLRNEKGQEKLNGYAVGYQGDAGLSAAGQAPWLGDANKLSSLWQYKLKWNSPLINKGVSQNTTLSAVTKDFYGGWLPKSGKYDIGVNEQG